MFHIKLALVKRLFPYGISRNKVLEQKQLKGMSLKISLLHTYYMEMIV